MGAKVLVRSVDGAKFTQEVEAGKHRLLADEPESVGGDDRRMSLRTAGQRIPCQSIMMTKDAGGSDGCQASGRIRVAIRIPRAFFGVMAVSTRTSRFPYTPIR